MLGCAPTWRVATVVMRNSHVGENREYNVLYFWGLITWKNENKKCFSYFLMLPLWLNTLVLKLSRTTEI